MCQALALTCLVVVIGIGCTPSPPPSTAASPADDAEDPSGGWTTRPASDEGRGRLYDDAGRPLADATVDLGPADALDRGATVTIGADVAPVPSRPPRVGKRDVALHGARLDNAMRMLARAGRFNLVVEGDLSAAVSLELRAVEPFDAALTLAEANHLRVRFERGTMIVGRAGEKP